MRNAHSHRDPSTSFLWATVREPQSRANSAFFFFQSRNRTNETQDQHEQRHLQYLTTTVGNQLRQMRRRKEDKIHYESRILDGDRYKRKRKFDLKNSIVTDDPHTLAFDYIQEQTLQWYDFIAVAERWDESMVVLKLLLSSNSTTTTTTTNDTDTIDLEYADFVVLKSKGSGAFSRPQFDKHTCLYVPKSTTSPKIDDYLQTTYRQTNPDSLLYAAVNRSLDLTIDWLGRALVQDGVRRFRTMQALAEAKCLAKAVFPCHPNGTFQTGYTDDCYELDWGCGYRCVDQVLEEYSNNE
jgi:hypothetical protein